MRSRLRLVVLAAALTPAACSGASDGDTDGTGAPDGSALLCNAGGGEPFDLSVGYMGADSTYVELADGDDATLVLGAQGLLMLHLETRAALSIASDEVCFTCRIEVGPTDSGFAGAAIDGPMSFSGEGGDSYAGAFNVILGSPDASDAFADAQVEVTMNCDGNGMSGSLAQSLWLRLPPS